MTVAQNAGTLEVFCPDPTEIDTHNGIQKSLESLRHFYALLRAREQAAFASGKDELQSWLILGRYYLAGFLPLRLTVRDACYVAYNVPYVAHLPNEDAFLSLLPRTDREKVQTSSWDRPPFNGVCANCGKGWDLTNAHDCEYVYKKTGVVSGPTAIYHSTCYREPSPPPRSDIEELEDEAKRILDAIRRRRNLGLGNAIQNSLEQLIDSVFNLTNGQCFADNEGPMQLLTSVVELRDMLAQYSAVESERRIRNLRSREIRPLREIDADNRTLLERSGDVENALRQLRINLVKFIVTLH